MEDSTHRIFTVPQKALQHYPSNKITTCKYNCFTFLPKNLWYQFQKIANVYFLIIAVMQCIPEISVSGGVPTMLLPLVFVLTLSAVKDLLEDLKRRKSDQEENSRTTDVWNRDWMTVRWQDVKVGHVVKIRKDENFPADLVVLATSDPKGICYIETKSLDGETNLKHKLAPKSTQQMLPDMNLDQFHTLIQAELPNSKIYHFDGTIDVGEEKLSLGSEQLLLRGSSLKNTEWVIGVVVYTGHESKIMLNSAPALPKFSRLEQQLNKQIIYIFLMQVAICVFCALFYTVWYELTSEDNDVYLPTEDSDNVVVIFILIFFSWMLIFTQFVPISLIVTLELVKFIQAMFIAWDLELYYEPFDTPAKIQSSNLNEELGQIHYIFSDKTGTVTRNIMEFRKFSCGGVPYGTDERMEGASKVPYVDFVDDREVTPEVETLMTSLAICHTIVTEEQDGVIEYKASSPDELALVSAAKYFGIELKGRDNDQNVVLEIRGETVVFEILHVLEFTSDRKRMSVVVRYPDGSLYLLCKGADNVLNPRLISSPEHEATWEYLESYAAEGLRTLIVARRFLEPEYYQQWNDQMTEAKVSMEQREHLVQVASEEIEREFELLGVTAVEDKLQDKVPESIASLRETGIKLWLLTGDKVETAINIGYSCSLLTNQMGRVIVDGNTANSIHRQLQEALMSIKAEIYPKFALVITGDALLRLSSAEHFIKFLKVIEKADVVIACRVSPQQKAEIVKIVRETQPGKRTLAIGDGANDVNMILAAHVGVGIAGLEGTQAVRAADFSIAQFCYLKRLMFVHGRECYRRNANLVCYNFYKNVLFAMPLFVYGMFSAYSAQILYNVWTYQLYNVIFCSLPIMIYAIFDRDLDQSKLENSPRMYQIGFTGELFNTKVFWLWLGEAIFQAFLICIPVVFAISYVTGDATDGKMCGMWVVSDLVYATVVIIANLKILCFSIQLYWFSVLAIGVSITSYFLVSLLVTAAVPIVDVLDNFDGRGSTIQMLGNPNTYNVLLLVVACSFFFVPIISHINSLIEILRPKSNLGKYGRYIEAHARLSKSHIQEDEDSLSEEEMPRSTYAPLLYRRHTGFAFSGEPGHAPQITNPDFH